MQIAMSLTINMPFDINFINLIFQSLLNRSARPEEIKNFEESIENGMTQAQFIQSITASDEFKKIHSQNQDTTFNNDELIELLYQSLLKRPSDAGGFKNYKALLEKGMSQKEVIQEFLSSEEFRNVNPQSSVSITNKLLFEIIYDRRPTEKELHKVNGSGLNPNNTTTTNMRRLIGNHDRYNYNTPITIRFGKEDIFDFKIDDLTMSLDSADGSVSHMIRTAPNGHYEWHMTKLFKSLIKEGMKVADIGANIGYFTLIFAKCVGPQGHVYSFDPNSENCRLLMLNVLRNNISNVTLYPFGLSNKIGSSFFSPCIGSNGAFLPDGMETIFNKNCIVIPTVTLDSILDENLDFIKMDTEGAEGLIISGGQSLIQKCRPLISSEFSMEMLPRVSQMPGITYFDMFTSLSYKAFMIDRNIDKPLLTPIPNPKEFLDSYGDPCRIEDLLFVPEEKLNCIDNI